MEPCIDLTLPGGGWRHVELERELGSEDGDQFILDRAVRGGGNGVVFRAERFVDGVPAGTCAVKLLRTQDPTRLDRFDNEIRIVRALNHPRITTFYGSGRIQFPDGLEIPWMAMALGRTNLQVHVDEGGPVSWRHAARAGAQMAEALQHLHDQGIIHRDVKPANFVWSPQNNGDVLMIDFGLAKYIGEDVSGRPFDTLTRSWEFVGAAHFAAPELIAYARDKKIDVDHRSDIFSLGKVVWFTATRDVICGVPSRKRDPSDGRLRELVLSLVQDDPDERPGSAAEVAAALRAIADAP